MWGRFRIATQSLTREEKGKGAKVLNTAYSDVSLACVAKKRTQRRSAKDGSATIFKAEAPRTQSREFLTKKCSDLY
jgi:hypothetical protein